MNHLSYMLMALTMITSNVNGLHNSLKWSEFWQAIPRKDIICLQETHLVSTQERAFKLHAQSYDFFYVHGTTGSSGVCVAIQYNTSVSIVKSGEIPGRLLALNIKAGDFDFDLVCIYALNNPSERSYFFARLLSFCTAHTLLIGDFNSVTVSGDRMSGNLDPTSSQLQSFLGSNNFTEPLGNCLNTFTYHHLTISICKSCINRAYTNFPNRWIGYTQPCSYSDHYYLGLFIPKPDDLGPQP